MEKHITAMTTQDFTITRNMPLAEAAELIQVLSSSFGIKAQNVAWDTITSFLASGEESIRITVAAGDAKFIDN